jgi:hypothetical protein
MILATPQEGNVTEISKQDFIFLAENQIIIIFCFRPSNSTPSKIVFLPGCGAFKILIFDYSGQMLVS